MPSHQPDETYALANELVRLCAVQTSLLRALSTEMSESVTISRQNLRNRFNEAIEKVNRDFPSSSTDLERINSHALILEARQAIAELVY